MLYTASPIFYRDVFQKPISHTNNKLNEHGGGACDDLRSRVFYNIVIHIRQGSGDTRGMCQVQKCQKAKSNASKMQAVGPEVTREAIVQLRGMVSVVMITSIIIT